MDSKQQLELLRQSVREWNKWRARNRGTTVNLFEANLNLVDLTEVDLQGANLRKSNLCRTNLRHANLRGTDLSAANLRQADLSYADLGSADLRMSCLDEADLTEANLRSTKLSGAHFQHANLKATDLSGATCTTTDFSGSVLVGSNFREASIYNTVFRSSDLSEIIGLDSVDHSGPSFISTDTFSISKGKIPEAFLRGCGLSDWQIESTRLYNPELSNDEVNKILYKMYDYRACQALQISPIFISYSHADAVFVDKIEKHLQKKGVRFWRDVHDAVAGRLETQIDEAIQQHPTVLLVLSEHALSSDWVEHEVDTARKKEKELRHDVLCPVALDDSWKNSPWPKRLMAQVTEYNVLDFSAWRDDSKFADTFNKLINGLGLFYK